MTPATHAIVNARSCNAETHNLRDVIGWSRPFRGEVLPGEVLSRLRDTGTVVEDGALLRPTVRFSSLDGASLAHSSYPPTATDAVFFGSDTMRSVPSVGVRCRSANIAARTGEGTRAGSCARVAQPDL